MQIFLHEFPSSPGVCYELSSGVYSIVFKHWVESLNITYTFKIVFKWCDVKVCVTNISCLGRTEFKTEDDLRLFNSVLIDILTLFHKYDNYLWLPKAQIPRILIKQFYEIFVSI